MKRSLFLTILFITLINATAIKAQKNKIGIIYLGYEIERLLPDFNNLKFEIVNNSQDTLYLSKKKIIVKVQKGYSYLKEGILRTTGQIFVRPIIRKTFYCKEQIEYNNKIEKLKYRFANKLFNYKFKAKQVSEDDKEYFTDSIVSECIILMPKEAIDYQSRFISKEFDKTCRVTASYKDDKE